MDLDTEGLLLSAESVIQKVRGAAVSTNNYGGEREGEGVVWERQ